MIEEKVENLIIPYIEKITNDGLNTNNIEHLYKLYKIRHMIKEENKMYDNYGRRPIYNSYGRDMRYRGHDYIDRIYEDYNRYEEGRSRYGANEDTRRSLEYMLKSMEDFAHMLRDEANSQEEVMMIKQTAQRIANM